MNILRRFLSLSLILLFPTLTLADSPALNGKVFLYYDNGLKKIEKEYKDGMPIGTWKGWHQNGNISIVANFENIALDGYSPNHQITKIEVRYPDQDSTIRFKGEAFAAMLLNIQNKNGNSLTMPMWDFLYQSYNKQGEPNKAKELKSFELTDANSGVVYTFPWSDKE